MVVLAVVLLPSEARSGHEKRRSRRRAPRRERAARWRRRSGRRRSATGRCTNILLTRSCRKPADKSWCLQPMQSFTYTDVKRAADRYDPGLRTEFAYSTAKFAALMSPRDGPLSDANLHHYILHRGNRYATHVLERMGKFRGKHEFLLDRDLPEMADWTSCAVVRSSPSVLKRSHGREIDGHSAVIRFNEAPTKGFEKHVGSKTTVRLQNPERQGFAEGKELCLTKNFSNLSNPNCKIVPLSPQFIAYSRYYWHWNPKRGYTPSIGPKRREKRLKMSTGFIGIALALHLCSKVTLYGFEAGAGDNGHYYNKTNTRGLSDWHIRHPWQLESDCIAVLKGGVVKNRT